MNYTCYQFTYQKLGVFNHCLKYRNNDHTTTGQHDSPGQGKRITKTYDRSYEPKSTPDNCTPQSFTTELAATVPGTPTMLAF